MKWRVLNSYMEYILIKGYAKNTKDAYTSEAKLFLMYIDNLAAIDTAIVFSYLERYADHASASKNSHASALRVFLSYLASNGYERLKTISIPYIKCERKLPRILPSKELLKRFNITRRRAIAFDDWQLKRDYALLMLLYATGMRISEALKFSRSDIDKNWILIQDGKGGKDRYVPIADEAINALDTYIYSCPFSFKKSFFVCDAGKPMTSKIAREIVKRSVGLQPHDLRHHFATHLILNNCDVSIVSEFLGHSSLSTTQIYTHIQNPQLQKTVIKCHPMAEGEIYAI